MSTFQVRLLSEGDYQKIEANSAKEAAEKHYGSELSEIGNHHQLRVLVHKMMWPQAPSATCSMTDTNLKTSLRSALWSCKASKSPVSLTRQQRSRRFVPSGLTGSTWSTTAARSSN